MWKVFSDMDYSDFRNYRKLFIYNGLTNGTLMDNRGETTKKEKQNEQKNIYS